MSSEVETPALCAVQILQAITKVTPVGVALSNQLQFLISPPVLYLFFPRNPRKDIAERFNMNKRVDFVPMCKAFDQSGSVLPNSSSDIVGYPDV
jgi:hypothetical protein